MLKNGLKSRDLWFGGVHHSGWWPHFLAFSMPLIGWRLGQNYTITQKSGVSVIVSEFCVIVLQKYLMVLVTSRMEYQYGCVKWSLTLKQNTDGGVRFLIRFICKIFAMNTCNIWKSVIYYC